MGYVCPVCEDPQSDGEHLANHLAFTAMLGDRDHEVWLDEHAPGWADSDPDRLADVVTDHAEETEYPQVFEDTTGDGHDHAGEHGHAGNQSDGESPGPAPADVLDGAAPAEVPDPTELSEDVDPAEVLAEAQELTRQRRENATGDEVTDSDDGTDDGESNDTEDVEDGADGEDVEAETDRDAD